MAKPLHSTVFMHILDKHENSDRRSGIAEHIGWFFKLT